MRVLMRLDHAKQPHPFAFLVPAEYCGMFFGDYFLAEIHRKGAQAVISDCAVNLLGASQIYRLFVSGTASEMKVAIPMIVRKLGMISVKVREDAEKLRNEGRINFKAMLRILEAIDRSRWGGKRNPNRGRGRNRGGLRGWNRYRGRGRRVRGRKRKIEYLW